MKLRTLAAVGLLLALGAGGASARARSLGVDARGELYVVPYSYGTSRLYRLAPGPTS